MRALIFGEWKESLVIKQQIHVPFSAVSDFSAV